MVQVRSQAWTDAIKTSAQKKKECSEHIRAQYPDQLWHADITQFVTADNSGITFTL